MQRSLTFLVKVVLFAEKGYCGKSQVGKVLIIWENELPNCSKQFKTRKYLLALFSCFFLLGQKPIEWKMVGLGGVIYTHLAAIYFPRLAQAAVLQVCEGIPLQPTRPAPRNLTFASLFWTKGRLRFRGLLATLHHHKLQRWWRTATSRRERKSWGIILVKRRSKRYLYQKGFIWMDCWIDWS